MHSWIIISHLITIFYLKYKQFLCSHGLLDPAHQSYSRGFSPRPHHCNYLSMWYLFIITAYKFVQQCKTHLFSAHTYDRCPTWRIILHIYMFMSVYLWKWKTCFSQQKHQKAYLFCVFYSQLSVYSLESAADWIELSLKCHSCGVMKLNGTHKE